MALVIPRSTVATSHMIPHQNASLHVCISFVAIAQILLADILMFTSTRQPRSAKPLPLWATVAREPNAQNVMSMNVLSILIQACATTRNAASPTSIGLIR